MGPLFNVHWLARLADTLHSGATSLSVTFHFLISLERLSLLRLLCIELSASTFVLSAFAKEHVRLTLTSWLVQNFSEHNLNYMWHILLDQCFSDFKVHSDYLRLLLKCRAWDTESLTSSQGKLTVLVPGAIVWVLRSSKPLSFGGSGENVWFDSKIRGKALPIIFSFPLSF